MAPRDELEAHEEAYLASLTTAEAEGDERAVEAVRQWRFSPAKRYGTPVDVLVEVAMEFKLR